MPLLRPEPSLEKLPKPRAMEELTGIDPTMLAQLLGERTEPAIIRGLVADWPATQQCQRSLGDAASYLSRFWTQQPVTAYVTEPGSETRLFYNEDCTGFNFRRGAAPLHQVFQKLNEHSKDEKPPVIYVGSSMVDKFLPGFRAENDLPMTGVEPLVSAWLGNESRISAHYDFPLNIACVVAGRRRFTVFPPDQLKNLYVGPVDVTPAGQPISLVDFERPDLARFPRFAKAMAQAQVAELAPGDAIFIPGMWWHHVASLSKFNMLVNYWWLDTPDYLGSPSSALLHAILALKSLPKAKRKQWQALFEHYVFEAESDAFAHIPEAGRGVLGEVDRALANQLRAELINKLK
ncbi:cupin-like domain-containing protein [Simiduia sp. 21SJ11W-1]|uniref:cupin-like domain-containing protein n=1 Tax=Simiduia sp. 21SJ11W-1 TaxID=2909669 RepID=UPI00209EF41A|nr:cupin-like domain-containing protein [Simiduia sp. 21SJ11W-1]UTA47166.1 cupin-like domain-containing protein [Simiduia sp. 21SJ11W-1]